MRVYYENISELFYEDEKKSKDLNAKSMEGSNFNLLNLVMNSYLFRKAICTCVSCEEER